MNVSDANVTGAPSPPGADPAGGGGWRPVNRLRAYEQVLDAIESRIRAGHLAAGDLLPSERELAGLLGVSRPSVREALRVLEWSGLLSIRSGAGDAAGSVLTSEFATAVERLVRLHALLASEQPGVARLRQIVDAVAAEMAAHADAAEHRRIGAELAAVQSEASDPQLALPVELHERLRRAIGAAAHDPVVAGLVAATGPGTPVRLSEWSDVVAAIVARDAEGARLAATRVAAGGHRSGT